MSYRRTLPEISPFTFGTTKVYDASDPQHIKVVRAVMDAGVWFHTSPTYGKGEKRVYEVLRRAFAEAPDKMPRCIVKIDPHRPDTLRKTVEGALSGTGMERVDIAQIITYMQPHSQEDLQPGWAIYETMCALQDEGKVGSYVLELNTEITDDHFEIVRREMYDGYIFYYNVVQRGMKNNSLYDLLLEKGAPLLSLRTMGGGPGDMGGTPAGEEEATRRFLRDLCQRAGCDSEAEFRIRFPLSNPAMVTTIGATSDITHQQMLIEYANPGQSLPREVFEDIESLHRRWYSG
jgi:aryl-alcohol dehydrogenase-like predicted oxidoreductase